ncbi:hypothetical protein R1sor_017411 [Riccia sorocarpa]|uniref:Uncharacterized protein n=1 Tax=Riccia sorocarpa TaxID=122646 RepID=A0ABD3IA46_9MARC
MLLRIWSTSLAKANIPIVPNLEGLVLDEARTLKFPHPLMAAAQRQGTLLLEFMPGCASGYGNEICSAIKQVCEKVIDAHSSSSVIVDSSETMEHNMEGLVKTAQKVDSASFIGLGAVGFRMPSHFVKGGSQVVSR